MLQETIFSSLCFSVLHKITDHTVFVRDESIVSVPPNNFGIEGQIIIIIIIMIMIIVIIIADHPSNTKGGGVCICYSDKISIKQMSHISVPECLACEIDIGNKKGYVITLYCSPSQNQGEFEHFLLNIIYRKPFR